jgi:hypothetical protein
MLQWQAQPLGSVETAVVNPAAAIVGGGRTYGGRKVPPFDVQAITT